MKAQFFSDIDTRYLEGPHRVVLAPFAGYSARYDITWCVPVRFVGDESSVPRLPLAYWIFGGRGNKECWPHDMGYRWRLGLDRIQWDMLFHEMAAVRHSEMTKQSMLRSAWRWTERNAMTGAVLGAGWAVYKNYPGCLDYRKAKREKCSGVESLCIGCDMYYRFWRQCVWQGYAPEIVEYHENHLVQCAK